MLPQIQGLTSCASTAGKMQRRSEFPSKDLQGLEFSANLMRLRAENLWKVNKSSKFSDNDRCGRELKRLTSDSSLNRQISIIEWPNFNRSSSA
jgi:hypothetical protein